jgi:hypothetical protein
VSGTCSHIAFSAPSEKPASGLTPRWSGRVEDKVPSANRSVRAAQLNR